MIGLQVVDVYVCVQKTLMGDFSQLCFRSMALNNWHITNKIKIFSRGPFSLTYTDLPLWFLIYNNNCEQVK